jgi:ribonuclease BN (tRNA processing enzyme)
MAVEKLKDTITFLGTGGARFTVAKQLLATGGAWLNLGGTEILMDPGPGSLVYAIKQGCDPTKLSGIILSHKHLDHSVDINVMIEAMTESGWKQRGIVYAPGDAFEDGAVILPYVSRYPEKIELLSEGGEYVLGDVRFKTPVKHIHQVETYGFTFQTSRHKFSWITDTKLFDSLAAHYRADLLVINVLCYEHHFPVDHLSLTEAKQIIREIKPRMAVLTHFGMPMWKVKPWEIEDRISDETGTKVIAARDGMVFDLDDVDKLK